MVQYGLISGSFTLKIEIKRRNGILRCSIRTAYKLPKYHYFRFFIMDESNTIQDEKQLSLGWLQINWNGNIHAWIINVLYQCFLLNVNWGFEQNYPVKISKFVMLWLSKKKWCYFGSLHSSMIIDLARFGLDTIKCEYQLQ